MQTIGYKTGFRYMTDGKDVYRNDYADPPEIGARWFSTMAGFASFEKAFGPLEQDETETALCNRCFCTQGLGSVLNPVCLECEHIL